MSANATAAATASYGDLSKMNFTGGFPTSSDLAPSIVFLIIYVTLLPLLLWRVISIRHRGLILIRPCIFVACRLGMLGLRAYMSKDSYGEGELIAELVLVSIGYLFLMEPVIEMWRRHVATAVSVHEAPRWVTRLSWVLKYALLAAIGTAVAGASMISSALNDSSTMSTVISLRKASAILSFSVAAITLLAILSTHVRFKLDARRTAYLVPLSCCLIVIAVYRLVQIYSTDPSATIRKPACFWVLQMVFELIVFVGILSISIPAWFPKNRTDDDETEKDVEMGSEVRNTEYPESYAK
ncbi:hypothetical protein DB88DRAFT_483378 [Papiliotrema laurentii]|uniref:Uncharacterized protein n=1 Tax=Papiliotrema laurentii TaxID=5418 RepID=A0AAD9FSJ4_PAPLA|nr:hypothetical protein DB88DRAFT_483378 [Papiliotrema laurentii]